MNMNIIELISQSIELIHVDFNEFEGFSITYSGYWFLAKFQTIIHQRRPRLRVSKLFIEIFP